MRRSLFTSTLTDWLPQGSDQWNRVNACIPARRCTPLFSRPRLLFVVACSPSSAGLAAGRAKDSGRPHASRILTSSSLPCFPNIFSPALRDQIESQKVTETESSTSKSIARFLRLLCCAVVVAGRPVVGSHVVAPAYESSGARR